MAAKIVKHAESTQDIKKLVREALQEVLVEQGGLQAVLPEKNECVAFDPSDYIPSESEMENFVEWIENNCDKTVVNYSMSRDVFSRIDDLPVPDGYARVIKMVPLLETSRGASIIRNHLTSIDHSGRVGALRKLYSGPSLAAIDAMAASMPNIARSGVFQAIAADVARDVVTGDGFLPRPILLVGPPGAGKSLLGYRLGDVTGAPMNYIDMSNLTAGWVLSGSDEQWKSSKMGLVLSTLLTGPAANPIFFLDELDKCRNGAYDPLAPLYSLLEKMTAGSFKDEHIPVPCNAGNIVWVASANNIDSIPSPIQSRFRVFWVEVPTREEKRAIASHIWTDIVEKDSAGQFFRRELDDDLLDELESSPSPRTTLLALQSSVGERLLDIVRAGGKPEERTLTLQRDSVRKYLVGRPSKKVGFSVPLPDSEEISL